MSVTMPAGTESAVDVLALIIKALTEKPCRPIELLASLEKQGFTEAKLKDAIDVLFDQDRLELSPDRFLKVKASSPNTI
jgi:hypothetical protein